MTRFQVLSIIYLLPLLFILFIWFFRRRRLHEKSAEILSTAISDGLTEPASLHPIIDPMLCTGCAACVSACPEKNVIGMVDRFAELISPTNCIGHGACKTSCPQDAITLVFGTATRGVEIPEVSPNFESSVKGIFIAGELGGMGLIRNAIEQGRQAMDSIVSYLKNKPSTDKKILDCFIVGSGPAGLSATLGAKSHNLNCVTIDQNHAGGTVANFPRGKVIMTQQATMPLVGKVKFGEVKKEVLMDFWLNIIDEHNVKIQHEEILLAVEKLPDQLFKITTSLGTYTSRSVLLAIGRRGSPRKLNVLGEERSKVVYRLIDAEQYENQSVLVVGGGDSAIEAACSIADLGTTDVSLSYRKDSFARAKAKNRERLRNLEESGKLKVFYSSQILEIEENHIRLSLVDKEIKFANDAVIICAGGILPTGLLKDMGISITTKFGTE